MTRLRYQIGYYSHRTQQARSDFKAMDMNDQLRLFGDLPEQEPEYIPSMTEEKRLAHKERLCEIDAIFHALPTLVAFKKQQLLHEAMQLCEELGDEQSWREYKIALEQLQRAQFKKKAKK